MQKITVEMTPNKLTMEIDREAFAIALKTWRIRHALTQAEAAKKLHTSRSAVNRVENGHDNIGWMTCYKMFYHLANELKTENVVMTLQDLNNEEVKV